MSTDDATTGCGESFIFDLRKGGKPMTTEEQKRVDRLERAMMNIVLMLGSESAQPRIRERCKEIIRDCDIPVPDPPAPEPSAFEAASRMIYGVSDESIDWKAARREMFLAGQAYGEKTVNARMNAAIIKRLGEGCGIDLIVATKDEAAAQARGETIGRKKWLEEAKAIALAEGSYPTVAQIRDLINQEPDDDKGQAEN